MTNEKLLRMELVRAGAGTKDAANWLGISRQAFLWKLTSVREFKASEIYTLRQKLNLTSEMQDKIFFAPDVECKSTQTSKAVNG